MKNAYKKFNPSRILNRDRVSPERQALLAGEYYKSRSPRPVYVFPLNNHDSREFRMHLSRNIQDSLSDDRVLNEALCAELGYPFIEVDPADYE